MKLLIIHMIWILSLDQHFLGTYFKGNLSFRGWNSFKIVCLHSEKGSTIQKNLLPLGAKSLEQILSFYGRSLS